MIKAGGTGANGNPLLMLGLSGEGMTRLMAGEVIRLNDVGKLGLPEMTVVIMGGRTESDITARLRECGLVNDRTRIEESL